MSRTVTELRTDTWAECAYLLVIEGLPYAWVTDHPGNGLLGSGAGTWMGASETAIGSPEIVGARTVLPGLKLPGAIALGSLDLKSGMLQSTAASFEIVDFGGELLELFANEGKPHKILSQHIPPGITPIVASIRVGVALTTAANKYIGLEKIGPNGERRQFPCFPLGQLAGYQHVPGGKADDGPPPVTVSDAPLDFAGRGVALYRLYRDTTMGPDGYTSWPLWRVQHDAGGLVWWGTLRDTGELSGDRSWRLTCGGPDSLLRRRLGTLSPYEPRNVEMAELSLGADERLIAVDVSKWSNNDFAWSWEQLQSLVSTDSVVLTSSSLDEPSVYAKEIETIVAGTIDGTLANAFTYQPSGAGFMSATVSSFHGFGLKRLGTYAQLYTDVVQLGARLVVCLHEKVWRLLGYEPLYQRALEHTDENYVKFVPYGDVEYSSLAVQATGYWCGHFNSCPYSVVEDVTLHQKVDNDGAPWYTPPLYRHGVAVLTAEAGQRIAIGYDDMFLEGQPTVPRSSTASIESWPTTKAKYFAFSGKRAVGEIDQGGYINGMANKAEVVDFVQVARCSWRVASSSETEYGKVYKVGGDVTLYIEEWVDPRSFGFDYDRLGASQVSADWAFAASLKDTAIKVYPLNAYAYAQGGGSNKNREDVASVLSQILLSTGTATGYADAVETVPSFSTGLNDDATTYKFAQLPGGDCELADLGLGIPNELVASPSELSKAFNGVPDTLRRCRYAYVGPFDSYGTIESIIRPRGLMLTLRGRKYGVAKLEPFSLSEHDVEITERDLWGSQDDPSAVRPRQRMRAVGQLDETIIRHNWDPIEGSTTAEERILSRDRGALHRAGDLVEEFDDHGLRGDEWIPDARQLWGVTRPAYFSQRHFLVTNLTVSRIKGQDLHIGSRVLFTNPWVVAPTATGYTGVTRAAAIVTGVTLKGKDHAYELELLVFAGQWGDGWRYFAPIARVRRVTGTTVELYPDDDFLKHGEGSDASRMWTEPSWSGLGGNANVAIVEYDRKTWSITSTSTVQSVDAATNTITLASALSPTPKRDVDKLLVMVAADSQAAAWVNATCLPIVLDTHEYGSTPTEGKPFNDKKN